MKPHYIYAKLLSLSLMSFIYAQGSSSGWAVEDQECNRHHHALCKALVKNGFEMHHFFHEDNDTLLPIFNMKASERRSREIHTETLATARALETPPQTSVWTSIANILPGWPSVPYLSSPTSAELNKDTSVVKARTNLGDALSLMPPIPKALQVVDFHLIDYDPSSSSSPTPTNITPQPVTKPSPEKREPNLTTRSSSAPAAPDYWVLSLNGGGVRGLMTALELEYLEQITSTPLCYIFDNIVGTSIGGIQAIALGKRKPPSALVSLLLDKSPLIFPTVSKWNPLGKLWSSGKSFIYTQYPDQSFNTVLREELGTSTLGESFTNVGATVVDPTQDEPYLVSSRLDSLVIDCELGRCTAAAPTIFKSYQLSTPFRLKTSPYFVDGGTWVNDPSLQAVMETKAIAEAKQQKPFSFNQLKLVNFGTGNMPVESQLSSDAGLAFAAAPVVEMCMKTQVKGTQAAMRDLLGPNYYLFEPELPKVISLDQLTPDSITVLRAGFESQKEKILALTETDAFRKRLEEGRGGVY